MCVTLQSSNNKCPVHYSTNKPPPVSQKTNVLFSSVKAQISIIYLKLNIHNTTTYLVIIYEEFKTPSLLYKDCVDVIWSDLIDSVDNRNKHPQFDVSFYLILLNFTEIWDIIFFFH